MKLTKDLLIKIYEILVDCDYCKYRKFCGEGYDKYCFELDENKLPEIMKKLKNKGE